MAAADQVKYLQPAESLAAFRSKLRLRAETLDIRERQQILRLLAKEVLVSANTITIRHSIPVPQSGPEPYRTPSPSTGPTAGLPAGYLLRTGCNHTALRNAFLPGRFQHHLEQMHNRIILNPSGHFR
jgi:hypothetical protein